MCVYIYYLGAFGPTSYFLVLYLIIFTLFCSPPTLQIDSPVGSQLPQDRQEAQGAVTPIQVQTRAAAKHFIPNTGTNQLLNFYQITYYTTKNIKILQIYKENGQLREEC